MILRSGDGVDFALQSIVAVVLDEDDAMVFSAPITIMSRDCSHEPEVQVMSSNADPENAEANDKGGPTKSGTTSNLELTVKETPDHQSHLGLNDDAIHYSTAPNVPLAGTPIALNSEDTHESEPNSPSAQPKTSPKQIIEPENVALPLEYTHAEEEDDAGNGDLDMLNTSEPLTPYDVAKETVVRTSFASSLKRKSLSQEENDDADADANEDLVGSRKKQRKDPPASSQSLPSDEDNQKDDRLKDDRGEGVAEDNLDDEETDEEVDKQPRVSHVADVRKKGALKVVKSKPSKASAKPKLESDDVYSTPESDEEITLAQTTVKPRRSTRQLSSPAVIINRSAASQTPASSAASSSLTDKIPKILLVSNSAIHQNAPLKKWTEEDAHDFNRYSPFARQLFRLRCYQNSHSQKRKSLAFAGDEHAGRYRRLAHGFQSR